MFKLALVTLVTLAGCAVTSSTVKAFDHSALAASTAMLACDWHQTRGVAMRGWNGYGESNPIMGFRPSTERVDVYFLGTAVVNAALWLALPSGWRSVHGFAVAGFQSKSVAVNMDRGVPPCGI